MRFLVLLILFSLFNCDSKKNTDRQKQIAAVLFISANSSSHSTSSSCSSSSINTSNSLQRKTHSARLANLDCYDLNNYQFDTRIFSSVLSNRLNAIPSAMSVNILHDNKSLTFPVSTLLFGTKESTLFDEKGFKKNPSLYNYTEYRTTLVDSEKNFTGVSATSEKSVAASLQMALERCKKEFSDE
jgi:hypothetical protein